jgi:hypothetical protein
MAFGTWNDRCLYRPGTLSTITRELEKYKLHLVCLQEVKWEKEGTVRAGKYIFFYRKGNENINLEADFLLH